MERAPYREDPMSNRHASTQAIVVSLLAAVISGCGLLPVDPIGATSVRVTPVTHIRSDSVVALVTIHNGGDRKVSFYACATALERRTDVGWERRRPDFFPPCTNDLAGRGGIAAGQSLSFSMRVDDGLFTGEHRLVVHITGHWEEQGYVPSNSFVIVDQ